MKLDIVINYVCSRLFFDVSTLKHVPVVLYYALWKIYTE